jgi:hypothetical protein
LLEDSLATIDVLEQKNTNFSRQLEVARSRIDDLERSAGDDDDDDLVTILRNSFYRNLRAKFFLFTWLPSDIEIIFCTFPLNISA